jgi:hypothetical protein
MITAIELPEGENDPRLLARVKAVNGKTLLIFDPTDEKTPLGLIRTDCREPGATSPTDPSARSCKCPFYSHRSPPASTAKAHSLSPLTALSSEISLKPSQATTLGNERGSSKDSDSRELREQLEQSIGSDLPGLSLKGFEFHQTADLDKPLILDLHLSTTGYAHSAGPLLLLRPRVLGSHARNVPDVMEGKPRSYPIEIGHPGRWRDSFDITLPPGYIVDETPDPVNLDLDFASYHSSVSPRATSSTTSANT